MNHSTSFWQRDANLPGEAPRERFEHDVDLCIVGAGIVGAGTAHWAASLGLSGVVVEARDAAMGATGRNAGFILSGVADSYVGAVERYGREEARRLWALSIENRDTMFGYAGSLGVPHERCGSLLLAESEAEAAMLTRSAALLAEDGFEGEHTPYDPLGRGFRAGLRRASDGVTQPAALTTALLAASGWPVEMGAAVTGWRADGEGVTVRTARGTVRARWLFLAVNAWAGLLHPFFEGRVQPMRGQIYVTEPAPRFFDTAGYSDFGYMYFRQIAEPGAPERGRWLIGGARHRHFGTENHTRSEGTTEALQRDLHEWTRRHFPEAAELRVEHRWAGTMAFTDDGLPLAGRLPGEPRVGYAVAFNGHGMGLGVLVARQALAHLLDGAPLDPLFEGTRSMG